MLYLSHYSSPLGDILLAERNGALCGLYIAEQIEWFTLLNGSAEESETPVILQAKTWLDRYFRGEKPEIKELKLSLCGGSAFRNSVLRLLCDIPYGETVTYGDIARRLCEASGISRMSARAVGGAVGNNPLPLIIPCHRVIGAGNRLTGYSGGMDIKIKLLEHEGLDTSKMLLPKKK